MARNSTLKKKETFVLAAPEAQNVVLAGDFTGWDSSPKKMRKGRDGVWKVTVSLAPGRYEYKFIVDGQWQDDPQCLERSPNPYGGENCVRVVA